ncbi:hypothetical protein SAMN04487857_101167 [Pseudomonas sp. ok272]|uniref:membrane-targeted effector domain-containing toxin n=1 Tax=unclassified Pseudomonas TaxID=196821 RepID=UPI0008D63A0D|nr:MULTISPECIES: membrane-targeted effector domain-containing toxin [unclassified Pseudomonas]SEM32862.1 hypothetical protein SAMN04487857_101167 [Pseudomonas sp. ok272]SFM32731.1 hypothetical protein SAMN04487858_102167 [Pseudomonas sp. ok602]
MSTPTTPPSFDAIKGYLNQIGHHLFNSQAPLLPDTPPTAEQRYLERLDGILRRYREQFLHLSRSHFQALENADLRSPQGLELLASLKVTLNNQLLELDLHAQIDGKSRKSFMTFEAGFSALDNEARLAVQDRLLHPQAGAILERLALYPTLRPGLYALTFRYQAQRVELAGAFVVTQQNSPVPSDLTSTLDVGHVMLFTPARGLESFDSLAQLNDRLLQTLEHPSARDEFMQQLPVRYHALSASGIWPLELSPINDTSVFEHTFAALIDKRMQDVERALSLDDNPEHDPARLIDALEHAIGAALPDLGARLELRAQTLFERCLRLSAPDWYRSASAPRRTALAQHLGDYNQARQAMLEVLGPVATPEALSHYHWLQRLSEDLDIHDLDPGHLILKTRRYVSPIGEYTQERSLIEWALRGLHTGDERDGSDFLKSTTLTYQGAPVPYKELTLRWLVQQLNTLPTRVGFGEVQRQLHEKTELNRAIEHLLDQRISALAYTALLQGHLSEDDLQLIQSLRQGSDPALSASTLSLHEAQLQDVWVLRQRDPHGRVKRVLLCTPEAPQEQQFQAFDNEVACQSHVLAWALDNGRKEPPGSLADYLINRVALRFRAKMKQVLNGLSFKPLAQEYNEVVFGNTGSHADCLKAMAAHVLATRVDDYEFCTPGWYRSASVDTRQRLLKLADDAEGALHTYNDFPLSDARFPPFNAYLHEQAKSTLNQLLGRPQNDVDPDTVWAYSPPSLIGAWTPPPVTYTQLYRDGYADSVGIIDEKFSRSARFTGPLGLDISRLTPEKVARSVTGVWIGQRYINEVRRRLLNTGDADYDLRRNVTLAITQLQMHNAALECRLQGYIAGVDLQWLEQSIANMGDTSVQARNAYPIHRLMIDGDWVIDNYLFSHQDHPTLLYTPNAPDGISFREAKLFNYALKKIPGMLGYFVPRVAMQSQVRVQAFLEDAKRQLPDDLDKTSASPPRYDSTHRQTPLLDLRLEFYDLKQQRRIDDVEGSTVNRTQMITSILWTCVEWVTAVATAPFPVLSLSAGMLLAFKDGMLALHAYNQGDNAAALEHFAGYLLNSAGAIFTDLRPALRSLTPVRNPVRLVTASTEHAQAMTLIRQLEPVAPTPTGMQPVFFDGQALWAPKTPDPIGRYLLYRLDPATGKLVSTTRLVAPNSEGVWARTGVVGGAPKYETVPQTPGPSKDYGMPAKYWSQLEHVLDPQLREYLIRQAPWVDNHMISLTLTNAAKELSPLRAAYLQQVELLSKDADNFFRYLDPLPPRADVPPIEASSPLTQLTASGAPAGDQNLIIGAVPGSIASKQALIDNLDTLIEQGYKHLYVEYLPGDVFQPKLVKLNNGGSWRHIEKHLKAIDQSFGTPKDAEYSYYALVRKAHEKGMTIRALDASTSYQLEDVMAMAGTSPTAPRSNAVRNFYSHKVIAADSVDTPNERWIALVDESRLRTVGDTPGLADLQPAVALRVEDVGLDQPVGIWPDRAGAIAGDPLARADYRMTLHTAYKAPEPVVPPAAAAAAPVEHFAEFDVPTEMRDTVAHLAQEYRGLDPRFASSNPRSIKALNTVMDLRRKLLDKAQAYLADHVPPPRPTLPTITASTTPESFIKQVGQSDLPGLVIGEAHMAQSSKALLRNQMKTLKDAGYKTLYVEHLFTDLHQADLDVFHRTQRLPDTLKTYLKYQDNGHMPFYRGSDTYTEVIQAAGKHGIRVRALDCTSSYHVKGLGDEHITRPQMFSYFANQIIQADQAAQGPHKWIAFVGSAHTNTYLGTPGLAELQGTIGLHVRDSAPALARSIHPGYWETDMLGVYWTAVRSDFKLEVAIAGQRAPAPFVPVDRSRLSQPGHFLVERPTAAETNLLHHSNSGEIVSTPIQVDDNGRFFIHRWGMEQERFEYQNTLLDALKSKVRLRPAP